MPKIDRSSSDLEELPAPPIKPSSNFKTRLLYVAIETNKYCGTVASIIFWLGRPVVRFQQLRHRHKNCRMTDMEILTRLPFSRVDSGESAFETLAIGGEVVELLLMYHIREADL